MKADEHKWIFVVFRAILLSLLVSSPSIFDYFRYSGDSPSGFSEFDEPYYFGMVDRKASLPISELIQFRPDQIPSLEAPSPQNLTVSLVGKLGRLFDLKPLELALLLDVICFSASYLAFYSFFRILTERRLTAELAVVVLLCLPWCFAPNYYLHVPVFLFGRIVSSAYSDWGCLPVLRGPFTQLSYPLFGLSLYWGTRAILNAREARLDAYLAGLATGLLLYAYFFAWSAITGLLLVTFFVYPFASKSVAAGVVLRQIGRFLLVHFLVAIPGLVILIKASAGHSNSFLPGIPTYWYFSVEGFLIGAIALFCARKFRAIPTLSIILALITSASVSELVLYNLQPLLRVTLYPYHFSVFYIHPLISGVTALGIFLYLPLLWRSGFLRQRILILLQFSVLIFVVARVAVTWQNYLKEPDRGEVVQLVRYLKKESSDGQVAMFPYPNYHLGHFIRPLIEKATFLISFDFNISRVERAKRELLVALVYRGEFVPISICNPDMLIDPPWKTFHCGDCIWSAVTLQLCPAQEMVPRGYTPCRALSEFRLDMVVWDSSLNSEIPQWFTAFSDLAMKSDGGKFTVYRFRQLEAVKHFCKEDR